MAPGLRPVSAAGTRPPAALRAPVTLRPGTALAAEWPVVTERTAVTEGLPARWLLAAGRPVVTEGPVVAAVVANGPVATVGPGAVRLPAAR